MIVNRIPLPNSSTYLRWFITILLAVCAACAILLGLSKALAGALAFTAAFVYLKRVEDLFLFWLLTFSLFSVDSMAFLTVDTHPIITYDRAFLGILLLLFAKEIVLKQRSLLPLTGVEYTFLLFIFVLLMSILAKTNNKIMGARVLIDLFLIPFLAFFLGKHLISNKRDFDKFVNILFGVGIYISIMAIYERFARHDLLPAPTGIVDYYKWLRVNGPYEAGDIFGLCAAMCFFVALFKYIQSNKSTRFLDLFVLFMLLFAIVLCLFRGILLAWALGFLLWIIIRRKGLAKLVLAVLLVTVCTIPFVDQLKSSKYYEGRVANVVTVQSRLDKYEATYALFKKDPVTGVGFRNYDGLQHNTILALLSEVGIVGTAAFLLLVCALAYYGLKKYRFSGDHCEKQFSIIYLAILMVYLMAGLGFSSLFFRSSNVLFFAITGVALNETRDTSSND